MKKTLQILTVLFIYYSSFSQNITTVAGNGVSGISGDGGLATNAQIAGSNVDFFLAIDNVGNLYISNAGSFRIRKVDKNTGIITTVVGTGICGYTGDGNLATNAQICNPLGIAFDSANNLYFSDAGNSRIRKVTALTGIITTIAGNGIAEYSGDGGLAINAGIKNVTSLSIAGNGDIYIADRNNHRIRKIANSTNIITTVAGNGTEGTAGDNGPATSAELFAPNSVVINSAGELFIAELYNSKIRKVSTNGIISEYSNTGASGLILDGAENLYYSNNFTNSVYKIDKITNVTSLIAGNGSSGFSGDGSNATLAQLDYPSSLSVDYNGNLYIADVFNKRIRMVNNVAVPLSTNSFDISNNLKLYPNPAQNQVTIEANKLTNASLQIMDINGRVLQIQNLQNTNTINIENLQSGVYLFKISSQEGSSTQRVVKN